MPIKLPLDRVVSKFDPYRESPWAHSAVSRNEISKAIADGRFQPEPTKHTRKRNIERIAWLAINGWNDAIEIDVGVPECCGWLREELWDGWHRLAAAIYRQDETILASVCGSLEYAKELFGVDCTESNLSKCI